MRTPLVRVRTPEGRVAAVPAGGIIGRLPTAALRLEDARVSEAHALVSLRGGRLWLLALRGAVEVDGLARTDVALAPGQELRLAESVVLRVEAVELPDRLLAIELPDGSAFPLAGEVVCLVETGDPGDPGSTLTAVAHFVDPAAARFWQAGPGWRVLVDGQRARDATDGTELTIGGHRVVIREVDPAVLAARGTERRGQPHGAIRLLLTFAEATVERAHGPPVRLLGYDARILAELAEYAEPVAWTLVAGSIWRGEDPTRLRQNWDKAFARLRQHLATSGLRGDLVRNDGRGNVSLYLQPGDEVDRSRLR